MRGWGPRARPKPSGCPLHSPRGVGTCPGHTAEGGQDPSPTPGAPCPRPTTERWDWAATGLSPCLATGTAGLWAMKIRWLKAEGRRLLRLFWGLNTTPPAPGTPGLGEPTRDAIPGSFASRLCGPGQVSASLCLL